MGALQGIIDEVEPIVMAAFGLTAPTDPNKMNFFTAMQGAVQNFPYEVRAADIELPCAVIDLGTFTADTDWTPDDPNLKRFSFAAYIVAKQSVTMNQDTVNDLAMNLVYALDNGTTFSTFQVMEAGMIQSSIDSPINILLAQSKNPIVSACARWDPGFSCVVIHA